MLERTSLSLIIGSRLDAEADDRVLFSEHEQLGSAKDTNDNDDMNGAIDDSEVPSPEPLMEVSVLKEWSSHTYIPDTATFTVKVGSMIENLFAILGLQAFYSTECMYVAYFLNTFIPAHSYLW